MSDDAMTGPFDLTAVREVHLSRAPLVRVLSQVAWPEQTLVNARFGEIADAMAVALAGEYPSRFSQDSVNIQINPLSGETTRSTVPVHRLSSLDEAWTVHLATTFVTLECRRYTTRADMTARIRRILQALESVVDVAVVARIGWRYVNRIADAADYANLPNLVQDSVLGARAIPLPADVTMNHALSDSLFIAPRGKLAAKWAFLPPNATHDPTIEPATVESWVLDLDAFRDQRQPFSVPDLADQIGEVASLAYDFFRWAVKDSFLEHFGGLR